MCRDARDAAWSSHHYLDADGPPPRTPPPPDAACCWRPLPVPAPQAEQQGGSAVAASLHHCVQHCVQDGGAVQADDDALGPRDLDDGRLAASHPAATPRPTATRPATPRPAAPHPAAPTPRRDRGPAPATCGKKLGIASDKRQRQRHLFIGCGSFVSSRADPPNVTRYTTYQDTRRKLGEHASAPRRTPRLAGRGSPWWH